MILHNLQKGALTRVLTRLSFLGTSIPSTPHGLGHSSTPTKLPSWWTQPATYASASPKRSIVYKCTECGEQSPQWKGRCPSCAGWNTWEPSCACNAFVWPLLIDPARQRRNREAVWRPVQAGEGGGVQGAAGAEQGRWGRGLSGGGQWRARPLPGKQGSPWPCPLQQRGPGRAGCPTSHRVRRHRPLAMGTSRLHAVQRPSGRPAPSKTPVLLCAAEPQQLSRRVHRLSESAALSCRSSACCCAHADEVLGMPACRGA